ncbi:MAG: heme/steroid binding domain protein [Clostridia bacterium]|nr:heme/steroid binding domain protein [Clostridia bacterium]
MFNHCLCCCCPYYYYCSMQYTLGYKSHLKNTRREVNYMYRQNQFTVDELAQYDGSAGKPAYVAVSGIVYDVSIQSTWGGGTHFGLYAGKDLTAHFQACHDNDTILAMLPKVGVLV